MSRLIVKNLPIYISDARLREHFSQKGTVTDAKLNHKKNGASRRFGFIGYKTEAEAAAAKEYFDKTYVDASRIQVEIVNNARDSDPLSNRPSKRPRLSEPSGSTSTPSKHSKPSYSKQPNGGTSGELNDADSSSKKPDKKKSLAAQFMEVMEPKKAKTLKRLNEGMDIDSMPASAKEKHNGKSNESQAGLPPEDEGGISDVEWMRRRMMKNAIEDEIVEAERVFEQSDDENGEGGRESLDPSQKSNKPVLTPEQRTARELIESTGRLFLRNLSFTCTESDLQEAFSPFGELLQVHIPLDPHTKQPKGLAFVTFKSPARALVAYETMDRRDFQGRLLHILPAIERRPAADQTAGKKTIKDGVKEKRKVDAGKEFNWSMLYMNSDAVISSVADRFKITKADILNPESDNAAVKLALAETHIIQETKKYLEEEGIIIDAFSGSRVHRSKTTILVKNIPYGTTKADIAELFEKHGEIARLLMPPAGTMAVVDFHHPADAKSAFKGVAYKRMGSSIVYLEWAPEGVWDENKLATGSDDAEAKKGLVSGKENTDTIIPLQDDDDTSLPPGSTLFVKNLNFSTSSDRLVQVFRALAGFVFARVQMKPDPKGPVGSKLSMGYGFVGFKTPDDAKRALKTMHGHVLDRHTLAVSFAGRGTEDDGEEQTKDSLIGAKTKTTKMIVKNVPFEATKKDIRELFSSHGSLKSVRLPRKFDNKTRGFAFLEFTSRHEAENAMAALKHTHLLGRHLVLEWAEETSGMDVDELREKIKRGYVEDGKEVAGRKRKLDLDSKGNDAGLDGDDG